MAKRRRRSHKVGTRRHHRRRSLRGLLSERSVKPLDLVGGVFLGLVASAGATYGIGKIEGMLAAKQVTVPAFVADAAPLIGGAVAALGVHFGGRKLLGGHADGVAIGSLGTGVVLTGAKALGKSGLPGFSGIINASLKGIVERQMEGGEINARRAKNMGVVVDTRPALPAGRQGMGQVVDLQMRRASQFGVVVDSTAMMRGIERRNVP